MDSASEFEHSRDYVQSLARGMLVLGTFGPDAPTQSLASIAARSGLSRAAARRLVLTLVHLGYLRQDGKEYGLSLKILALGNSFLHSWGVTDILFPPMQDLAKRIGRNVALGVLDGAEMVCLIRSLVERIGDWDWAPGIGLRVPCHVSALGRALLTGLSATDLETWLSKTEFQQYTPLTITDRDALRWTIQSARDEGYAYVEQQVDGSMCAIAVPIRDHRGRVVAALGAHHSLGQSVEQTLTRLRFEMLNDVLPNLMSTAKQIGRGLPARTLPPVSLT